MTKHPNTRAARLALKRLKFNAKKEKEATAPNKFRKVRTEELKERETEDALRSYCRGLSE